MMCLALRDGETSNRAEGGKQKRTKIVLLMGLKNKKKPRQVITYEQSGSDMTSALLSLLHIGSFMAKNTQFAQIVSMMNLLNMWWWTILMQSFRKGFCGFRHNRELCL